jgi:adenylate kinase
MSLIFFQMPVQGTTVLDEARRELQLQDKQFGDALGFDAASEWSKAKHNVRPLNFHQLCQAPEDVQRAIWKRWGDALDQRADKDLVADLAATVERMAAKVDRLVSQLALRPAKADLRDADDERRTA